MTEPQPSFKLQPRKPRLKLPPGACDAHFHVFGPRKRFPFAPERSYTPTCDAPKETLFALHALLGIERGVVVQSAAHGLDNSASADLIAARPDRYVGVALVSPTIDVDQLKKLNAQGFRGARFHYMKHLGSGPSIDEALGFGKRLAELGWHLQIHCDGSVLGELAPRLRRPPVPVVIDHMARVDASLGLNQPAFSHLVSLSKDENIWVKVSGPERISRQRAPWRDAVPIGRRLVEEFGERALWGSDWPHPNLAEVPDDGDLVDLIAEIAPSEKQRQALLVDNPRRFYGFGKA